MAGHSPALTIILRAHEGADTARMLKLAHAFAVDYPQRRHGIGGCVIDVYNTWACVVYWTRGRAVVVRSWAVADG